MLGLDDKGKDNYELWISNDLQHDIDGRIRIIIEDMYGNIMIKNISENPAYPITLDLIDDDQRCFLNDNFFLLMPGEEKTIRITCDKDKIKEVKVDFWNGTPLYIS